MTWHAGTETLTAYAANRLGTVASASVEAHVAACAECRMVLHDVAAADPLRHEAVWDALVDIVDQPRRGLVERLLGRVGVAPSVARLLAGTRSLRLAWLVASAAAVLFAVIANGGGGRQSGVFLFLSPLLPLAAVAASHAAADEPVSELLAASPLGRFRLLLIRTVAAVAASAVLLTPTAVLASGDIAAAAWLLPALLLASTTLALGAWHPPGRATAVLGALWVGAAVAATRPTRPGSVSAALADFAAFQPAGQFACAVLTVAALAVAVDRSRVADLRSTL